MENFDINELLDAIVRDSGLSQDEIAQKLGMNKNYLSQVRKKGTKKVYMKLEKLQEELGLKDVEQEIDYRDELVVELRKTVSMLEKQLAEKHSIIESFMEAFKKQMK